MLQGARPRHCDGAEYDRRRHGRASVGQKGAEAVEAPALPPLLVAVRDIADLGRSERRLDRLGCRAADIERAEIARAKSRGR